METTQIIINLAFSFSSLDFDFQISINGQVHNVGTVVRVSNHYMVGIVLGILAALVAGAVLAFLVMKHLRKKKKGGPLSSVWTLVGSGRFVICGSLSTGTSLWLLRMYKCSSAGLMIKKRYEIFFSYDDREPAITNHYPLWC